MTTAIKKRRKHPIGEQPYILAVNGARFKLPIKDAEGRHKRQKLGYVVNRLRDAVRMMMREAYPPAHIRSFAAAILCGSDKHGYSNPITEIGFTPNPN